MKICQIKSGGEDERQVTNHLQYQGQPEIYENILPIL